MLIGVLKKIQLIKKILMDAGVPIWITPTTCKFHPSCSEYLIDSIKAHGSIKGGAKGFYRVLRCNPWSKGGFDPV